MSENNVNDPDYVPEHPVDVAIKNAIEFFKAEMIVYARNNVLAGITQAGKTKEVADYLSAIKTYGESGSLYAVIAEIDGLIASGVPSGLDPYVNATVLGQLKNNVQTYLGIPLT